MRDLGGISPLYLLRVQVDSQESSVLHIHVSAEDQCEETSNSALERAG